MASLISSVLWVPRGVSAQHPSKYDLSDPAELERVQKLGKIKLEDAQRDLEEMERLEKGVDGMAVDNDDGDGEGDEWEDDEDSEEDEDNDEKAAAKKAAAFAKAAKQVGGKSKKDEDPDDMSKYNLDTYDDERQKSTSGGVFSNIKGLSYYAADSTEDPYITLGNVADEDATVEKEELEVLPTDNLLVAAKTADEVSLLEVHVYEGPDAEENDGVDADSEGNLYVHHDTLLPAMPLCMEWGDYRPANSMGMNKNKEKGNLLAVGTMDKQIEIWDLDVVDGMFPEVILGDEEAAAFKEGEDAQGAENGNGESAEPSEAAGMEIDSSSGAAPSEKKKKKKKKKKNAATAVATLPYAHTDSVLSLSWNRIHRNLLASSSADSTIKLWDLSSPTSSRAIRTFSLHGDKKVQSLAWNPKEGSILLSGAWEGGIRVFDIRASEQALSYQLPDKADVEVLHWDPHSPSGTFTEFYVATGKGQVKYFDSRNLKKELWTLDAHDGPVAALDVNEFIPGCIVTGGVDKLTKVWSVNTTPSSGGPGKGGISLVASRDYGVGKVFSTLFSPDDPTTLALAGSTAKLQVWDAFTNAGFRRTFGDRLRALEGGDTVFSEQGRRAKGQGMVQVQTGGDDEDALTSDEE